MLDPSAAAGAHFDLVVKLRDDSLALEPWVVPAVWASRGLSTINCMEHGGLMDATFVVGRPWAILIFEGMSADS